MEKRRKHTQFLFFLFILCFHQRTVLCQERYFSESPSPSRPPEFNHGIKKIILSLVSGIVTGLLGALLFAFLVKCVVQYMNRAPILKGPVIFSPNISPTSLHSALASDNQLLGSSPNGKYYKIVLDNGLTFAVKILSPFERQSKSVKRNTQEELEVLASVKHRNLRSLRAYVRELDRFCLVYDYMPIGSLEDAMNRVRENELQMKWEARLKIAVGMIKGLQYLHSTCVPQVLHYNLKPSNVMLDAEFEPRLADCGLAKVMPDMVREPSGYSAPECLQNLRYTDKSDIFSFGLILGVLLTGRDVNDPFYSEAVSGGSFVVWLRHLQQAGEAREALDKTLLGEEAEEDEMLMAVRIAVVCISDLPADRPSSDELVPMLTQLNSF